MTRSPAASLSVLSLLLLLPLASAAAQAPVTVEPQKPRAADDLPTLEDVAGTWYSDFGYMELEIEGDEIRGTYSCCKGTLEGFLNVKRLELAWKDEIYGEGWAYLYWQDGGQRLEGVFGKVEDFGTGGQWNAVRIPELETAEPPQRFRVSAEHPRFGELQGTVLLDLSPAGGDGAASDEGEEGDDAGEIRGELRAHYVLQAQGKPFEYEMFNVLTGEMEDGESGRELVLTWMDPVKLRRGEIRLQEAEGGEGDGEEGAEPETKGPEATDPPGTWKGTWRPHFTTEGTEPFKLVPVEP